MDSTNAGQVNNLRDWWLQLERNLRAIERPRPILVPDDGPPDDVFSCDRTTIPGKLYCNRNR